MSGRQLSGTDLPLGKVYPDAPYNLGLLDAIRRHMSGETIGQPELAELEDKRRALWETANLAKNASMKGYARFAAKGYGFRLDESDRLTFEWMQADYRRIGYESDYYTCDRAKRELVPVEVDHEGPRVIVFATGRAFAENNARLGGISPEVAVDKARDVMSAQVYLVGSRLVPGYAEGDIPVVAVAYDMVTSEEETPALRIQAVLDPSFLHQVSVRAAERIFGPMLGELECYPTGRIVRRDGRILGKAYPPERIIANLSRLVLVGGSVGCLVTLQVARWLNSLLRELGVDEAARKEAAASFLILNLGPTAPVSAGDRTNLISVVNSIDEFVFSGNHVEPLVNRSLKSGRRIVADGGREISEANSFSVVLDVDGSLTPGGDGYRFDPLGTHFGHSLKYYANGLQDVALRSVVGRALKQEGAFRVGHLVTAAEAAGELNPGR
jgi:hypothetical protein